MKNLVKQSQNLWRAGGGQWSVCEVYYNLKRAGPSGSLPEQLWPGLAEAGGGPWRWLVAVVVASCRL